MLFTCPYFGGNVMLRPYAPSSANCCNCKMETEASAPSVLSHEIDYSSNQITNDLDFVMFSFTHGHISRFTIKDKSRQQRVRPRGNSYRFEIDTTVAFFPFLSELKEPQMSSFTGSKRHFDFTCSK